MGGQNRPVSRIAFFVIRPFHCAFLGPVQALLEKDCSCLSSSDMNALIQFRPQVLISADGVPPILRQKLPNTIFVFTRHGFGSKNYARTAFATCDFACVSSPWVRDDCIQRGWLPRLGFWTTGFVPMDAVFRPTSTPARPDGFSTSGPTILFAPTHNRSMSSIGILGADWIGRARQSHPELNVIIKPHPLTRERAPELFAILQTLARQPRTLWVEPDADVYPYLPMADVLLSDASAVMFYYLALDRPMILINNPQRFSDRQFFDAAGHEWTWRDMGTQIEKPEELPAAIRACVETPRAQAAPRAAYRQKLFGELTDGNAAQRLADHVRALLSPDESDRPWVEVSWNALRTFQSLSTAMAKVELSVPVNQFPEIHALLTRMAEAGESRKRGGAGT